MKTELEVVAEGVHLTEPDEGENGTVDDTVIEENTARSTVCSSGSNRGMPAGNRVLVSTHDLFL